MLNKTDVASIAASKVSLIKNLISDQTCTNLHYVLGTPVFDATYGHGISTATSVITLVGAGGFNDQRVTGVMRYRAPTTAGAEYMGVVARVQTMETAGPVTYYWARQNAGSAKLTKVVAGTFTNLATTAYALAADEDVTIVLSCIGSAISASFTSTSLGTVNLSATDSSIPSGGLMGYRTLSQVGWCSSIQAEQL